MQRPNIINSNSQFKDLLPILEQSLPFDSKDVWLWKIGFDVLEREPLPVIRLGVELEINGNTIILERETNNDAYISEWFELDIPSKYNMVTLSKALQSVLNTNQKNLKEFVDEFC